MHGEVILKSQKKLICPSLVGKSEKHHWEVEKVRKFMKIHENSVKTQSNDAFMIVSSSYIVFRVVEWR